MRKSFRGDVIFDDTPVFVPARSTFYSVGGYLQDNRKLEGIADCQDPDAEEIMSTEGGTISGAQFVRTGVMKLI